MTRSELATWIVRMGEKYPDRVGLRSYFHNDPRDPATDSCMLGQIGLESGQHYVDQYGCNCNRITGRTPGDDEQSRLCRSVTSLNDAGHKWGEIPKLLGLVPGEAPPEMPLVQPDTVTVPEEVCAVS